MLAPMMGGVIVASCLSRRCWWCWAWNRPDDAEPHDGHPKRRPTSRPGRATAAAFLRSLCALGSVRRCARSPPARPNCRGRACFHRSAADRRVAGCAASACARRLSRRALRRLYRPGAIAGLGFLTVLFLPERPLSAPPRSNLGRAPSKAFPGDVLICLRSSSSGEPEACANVGAKIRTDQARLRKQLRFSATAWLGQRGRQKLPVRSGASGRLKQACKQEPM
jgi:hypothetical protein